MTDRALYLDAAATHPLRPEARAVLLGYYGADGQPARYGNPSAPGRHGQDARVALERARRTLAERFGVTPQHLTFTSGATEANNQAILGYAATHRAQTPDTPFTVITTAAEHASVRRPLAHLAGRGARIRELPLLRNGLPDMETLDRWLAAPEPCHLACFTWVNNETGVIAPVRALADRFDARRIPLHLDGVQAVGISDLAELGQIGVTSAVVSAHKIGGPVGSGCLLHRNPARLPPLLRGGGQEGDRRAGTEATPLHVAAVAAYCAAQDARAETQANHQTNSAALRAALDYEGLIYDIHGASAPRSPSILSLIFEGLDSQSLIVALDMAGIEVSSGSACSSGSAEPSAVLRAMGVPASGLTSTIRLSFWETLSATDTAYVARVIRRFADATRR